MAAYTDVSFRQKYVIEFLSNEGIKRLKRVFGDNALSYSTTKKWIIHFTNGNKEITNNNVEK